MDLRFHSSVIHLAQFSFVKLEDLATFYHPNSHKLLKTGRLITTKTLATMDTNGKGKAENNDDDVVNDIKEIR